MNSKRVDMKTKQRGFTLIELLVVIAVIGILAAVILTALNQARDRGKVSTVQQELASLRSQAEIIYGTSGGSYSNFCSDSKVLAAVTDAKEQFLPGESLFTGGGQQRTAVANAGQRAVCRSTTTNWVASIPITLATNGDVSTFWCADSNGASKSHTGTIPSTGGAQAQYAYVCPAS